MTNQTRKRDKKYDYIAVYFSTSNDKKGRTSVKYLPLFFFLIEFANFNFKKHKNKTD